MHAQNIINVKNLCKSYNVSGNEVNVLKNLSLEVKEREKIAIVGPSGSGKSTLLNILAGLEEFDSGTVEVNELDYTSAGSKIIDEMRLKNYGFIFQSFYLIETLNVNDNIILPILLQKGKIEKEYVDELCEILDIKNRLNFYPSQLSGGEQQRTAIARALINKAKIIFADEPTGNLDYANSKNVVKLLCDCCEKYGQTLLLVTHDTKIAEYMDRTIELGK